MSFERMIPKSPSQLHEHLVKLLENRKHVVSAKINESSGQLRVDLSGMANFAGNPDFYLPIKRAKLAQAKELLDKLLSSTHGASLSDATALYDMIDPTGN